MFAPANQPHFTLTIANTHDDLQVLSLHGQEALSQPFVFDIELVSERANLDLEALLHQLAFLQLAPDGRGIHGQIYSVAKGDTGQRLTHYAISLRPRLAYLAHRINQRIFQNLSVPQIISQVLKDHGILSDAHAFPLQGKYPERVYCVQYDESDLHFIQRLCEEEGIHYHFEHSPTAHTLVFTDNQMMFPKLAPVPYLPDNGMVAEEPVINHFQLRLHTRVARTTRRDYNFKLPRMQPEGATRAELFAALEDYDYPGGFTHPDRGQHLAQRALERHRSDYRQVQATSNQPQLVSGHLLTLTDHPPAVWNDMWLLTEIVHEGRQPQVLEEFMPGEIAQGRDGLDQGYRNTFLATPWDVPHRPALKHPKPRMIGSQTALVTGPKGDEIHCDEHGRVKVQFHWDREGQGDDTSSCWLRVASGWAGAYYGAITIPRVGMEVLVTFLQGDPDQPLISGCLYHGEQKPPYPLPANKTRSVFKSLSSPGGGGGSGGSNELRIEDQQGAEQIYIHAQRDWDENVEHDQKIHIGHERHDTVQSNSYTQLHAEEHRITWADRKVEARASDHLTVAVDQHVRVGNGQFVEAGGQIHLKSASSIVIEAGMELTLKAGGSFIKIDAGGVKKLGALIRLNAGGTPGNGSGARPLLPMSSAKTDADPPGQLLLQAQRQSLSRSEPHCEICEQAAKEQANKESAQ